jgi:hypothetical protein
MERPLRILRPRPALAAFALLLVCGGFAAWWLTGRDGKLPASTPSGEVVAELSDAELPDAGLAQHMAQAPAFADAVQAATYRRVAVVGPRYRTAGLRAGQVTVPEHSHGHAGAETAGHGHAHSPALAGLAELASGGSALRLPLILAAAGRADLAAPLPVQPTERPVYPTAAPTEPTAMPPLPTSQPPAGVTYWHDAYPVLAARCTSCHVPGGIGPMALDSFAAAKASTALIQWAMTERFMPPLPADPNTSWPLDDPRIMSEAERATLLDWVAAGAPEGDPATAPVIPPAENPLGPPTNSYDIGADYVPRTDRTDDYRCFIIDPGLDADAEVRMFDVRPGNTSIYHHGILHLITADQVATVRRMDDGDPGPGYSCFGGSGVATSPWVATKTPGQLPMASPDGTAVRLPAGSVLVLQNHYNTINTTGPDRTKLDLWVAEAPVGRAPRAPRLLNATFRIPAGTKAYTATATARTNGLSEARPGLIWQAWPHMHMLGSGFRFDVKRRDGSMVTLLDIPKWDFYWQGGYKFKEPFELQAGDQLIMTCVWDNSPENQPYIGGQQQAPRDVRWGEGSLDEMCLGGVTMTDK